ncbi:sugar ABC transporter permease [Breznakiella homolactica]|uniref:Xylose transport system permease protein XylH n=1 Tax=Breznakiella homolactica TaxID=2798577 RepID=A0A7T8BAE3_9SPIR|nr:sugar ABC transporter permease [Breznakiella homolactica]QQO10579.1 sugar ABC transporter permease [Breznakiella homolactica]
MPSIQSSGIRSVIRKYSMYFALVIIMIVFSVTTGGTFLTPRNLTNLMFQTSYIAVLAIGVVLVIIAGHTDLSLGSLTGLLGGIMAVLQVKFGWSTPMVILAGVLIGMTFGAWHGFWIAFQRIPAFIVTLAGMLSYRGVLIMLTGGETIAPMRDSFKMIGQGYLPRISQDLPFHDTTMILGVLAVAVFIGFQIHNRRLRIKHGFPVGKAPAFAAGIGLASAAILGAFLMIALYRGIPYSALLLIFLTLILHYVSTRTPFGRYVFAIGGNVEAARLSGINIRKVNFSLYVLMGSLAAVSGMLFTARLNSATASAGTMFEFDAITAAIIGGASVMGGEGSVIGAVIGALVTGSLNNGMGLMNIPTDRQQIIKGLILLLVVWFDIGMRKKRR